MDKADFQPKQLQRIKTTTGKDFDNTSPRDTPATKVQALVAKWTVQRIVRNNRVAEPPRRLLSGLMLFRPWDMWIMHALRQQKERGPFGQKEGRERESSRTNGTIPRPAPSGPRSSTKKGTRTNTTGKAKYNRRRKKYISDWRRWRSQEDQQAVQLFDSLRYGHGASQETKGSYYGGIDLRRATIAQIIFL